MATVAVTYRTGTSRSALRTVIVQDARPVVLLADGGMELLVAKLICGTTCATPFWHKELGTSGSDLAVPQEQVVKVREMNVAAIAKHQH